MLPVRPLLMVGLHKNLCRFYMTNNYPLNNEYGPEGAMAGYVHWTSFQTFLDLVVYVVGTRVLTVNKNVVPGGVPHS